MMPIFFRPREFDERFFFGAGCAHPKEELPFEGYGATRHSPQTAIIEPTFTPLQLNSHNPESL
jgi:hypothetical protein